MPEIPAYPVFSMKEKHITALLDIEATSDENYWTEGVFKKHLSGKFGGLVAFNTSEPIAFLCFERRQAIIQITNMAVRPRYRRTGAGTLLVKRMTEMVPCEFESVEFCVRESNVVAQVFLRSLGFWCSAVARSYFIDKVLKEVRREDAYAFDYNPSKERKNVPICITNRLGHVISRPRAGSR